MQLPQWGATILKYLNSYGESDIAIFLTLSISHIFSVISVALWFICSTIRNVSEVIIWKK